MLNFLGAPPRRASVLRPKKPENGGQKAVEAGETEGSAAKVACYGGLLAFGNPGDFRTFCA